MKYLFYKSNLGSVLHFSIFPIGFSITWLLHSFYIKELYIGCAIFECIILYIAGYVYYFYEDHFEIIYYFRIIRRKKIIEYNSIKRIKYNDAYKGIPELDFFLENQRFPKFLSCCSFKKGGKILRFFKKKNIEIEIKIPNKRKRRIVENELYKKEDL
ncbi:MAG: hypothetical protein IKS33_05580 [Bacteroidales bacterium]|nr:hypothetical protein [Bacteroidales bacterium]